MNRSRTSSTCSYIAHWQWFKQGKLLAWATGRVGIHNIVLIPIDTGIDRDARVFPIGNIIRDILENVAESLRTLTVIAFDRLEGADHAPIDLLQGLSFPILRELHIRGPHSLEIRADSMPVLELLRVDLSVFARIKTDQPYPPLLQKVRVSRAGIFDSEAAEKIMSLIIAMVTHVRKNRDLLKFNTSSEMKSGFLFIQPTRVDRSRLPAGGSNHFRSIQMIRDFEVQKVGLVVLISEHRGHNRANEAQLAEFEWEQRVKGKPAVWGNSTLEVGS